MTAAVATVPTFRIRRLDEVEVEFARRVRARREASRPVAALAGWWAGGRLARLVRRYGRRTIVVLVALLAGLTLAVAPSKPAHADFADTMYLRFCAFDRKPFNPERVDDSLGPFLTTSGTMQNYQPTTNTRWGQYGPAGTYWGTYWLGCYDFKRQPVNMIATLLFEIVRWLATFAILLFVWTFRGEILNIFLDPAQGPGMSQLDAIIHRINLDVFLDLMGIAVLIGALVMAWRVLAARGGAADFIGKFITMALVAGFAMFYGGVPGQGPGASAVLRQVNDWTDQITETILLAFSGDKCDQGVRNPEDNAPVDKATALDCMAESFYETMIYEPWVIGEFGKYDDGTKKEADLVLQYQAFSWSDLQVNDQQKIDNPYGNDVDQGGDYCDDSGNKDKASTWNGKICLRTKMRVGWGVGDDQLSSASSAYEDIKTNNYPYWYNWSGGNANNRLMIAFLALIGSGAIALVVIILSVAYLMLEVSTIMFAMMAPVAFLIGLIPGFGMRLLLRWAELILGSFVRRIVLGLFVGLVTALYSAVLRIQMPWMMQLIIVLVIAFFGLAYRKKFTEAFTFNFSGSEAFHRPGEVGEQLGLVAGATIGSAAAARAEGKPIGRSAVLGAARGMSPESMRAGYWYSGGQWVRRPGGRGGRDRPPDYIGYEEEQARRHRQGNNNGNNNDRDNRDNRR